jgi:diketogulonate reductase-like aldo/keto reductase
MTTWLEDVRGRRIPAMLYGTAWKEDRTAELTERALEAGFRGIDTANQRKHYHEAGVGEALARMIDRGRLRREEVFLQTKFTYVRGQDHRLPYDPRADLTTQVGQSFASSLEHLGVEHLDSYVLHGPSSSHGLDADDQEVWRAMEALRDEGRVHLLGVSNVTTAQLAELCEGARHRPDFCQNRCFAARGWNADVRRVCRDHGVRYQGFSLLTANRQVWSSSTLAAIAHRHGRTPAQVILRFAHQLGMVPLTGTTDPRHMAADLEVFAFTLDPEEMRTLESLGG